MNMAENGILTEQLDQLHGEVHKIAETIVILYNMQRTIDQKASVIGGAMIEQKKKTEIVAGNQDAMEDKIKECHRHADERREQINASIGDVIVAIQNLKTMEERENTLLKSLEKLSKNQTNFMNFNAAFSQTAERDLNTVKTNVENIRSTLSHMNITDQVKFMNGKAVEIQKSLASYVSARVKTAAAVEQRTKRMEERILEMQGAITEQRKAVDKVLEVSACCEEKTIEMCDKLEKILATTENIGPAVKTELSLEDMFAISVNKAITDKSTFQMKEMDDDPATTFTAPYTSSIDEIVETQKESVARESEVDLTQDLMSQILNGETQVIEDVCEPGSLKDTFGETDSVVSEIPEPKYSEYEESDSDVVTEEVDWDAAETNGLSIHVMEQDDNTAKQTKGFLSGLFGKAKA